MMARRFTVRSRICRGRRKPGLRPTPRKLLAAIAVYVVGGVAGWTAFGLLIAMVLQ